MPTKHAPDAHTEEYLLPRTEALLAGTLALMTGLAHTPLCASHRELMATKVRANLAELAAQPHVSEALRTVLCGLSGQWGDDPAAAPAASAWPTGSVQVH